GSMVWGVGARPARTQVHALKNFWPVEGAPNSEFRWMAGPGVLGAFAACASCQGLVTFESSSADVSRMLVVRDERTGRVLARSRIPPSQAVLVRVPGVTIRT